MTKLLTEEVMKRGLELIELQKEIEKKLRGGLQTLSNEEYRELIDQLQETTDRLSEFFQEYFESI